MKVYVVIGVWSNYSSQPVGVFSTKEKAVESLSVPNAMGLTKEEEDIMEFDLDETNEK